VGEQYADFSIDDDRDGHAERARTQGERSLEPFSAGERRWVDEALATAARALDQFARRLAWQAEALSSADQDALLDQLASVADQAQQLADQLTYYAAEVLELLMSTLEARLHSAVSERLDGMSPLDHALDRSLRWALPQTIVRVFDEPEAHLHPAAQRDVLDALNRLRDRGSSIVLASHSPHFLARTGWQLLHAQRTSEGATISALTPEDVDARKALAGQLGWSRGQLLTDLAYVLVVEGEHDRMVLQGFYGDRLREAGVAMLRMHGTSNLVATADLDFVRRFLDPPVGVLLDYTRLDVVNSSMPTKDLRTEEKQLRHLRREARKRGRKSDEFALPRPDIVAYLDEELVRREALAFPGWRKVQEVFDAKSSRPAFKKWLAERYDLKLDDVAAVQRLVDEMLALGRRPPPELDATIDAIVQASEVGRS